MVVMDSFLSWAEYEAGASSRPSVSQYLQRRWLRVQSVCNHVSALRQHACDRAFCQTGCPIAEQIEAVKGHSRFLGPHLKSRMLSVRSSYPSRFLQPSYKLKTMHREGEKVIKRDHPPAHRTNERCRIRNP